MRNIVFAGLITAIMLIGALEACYQLVAGTGLDDVAERWARRDFNKQTPPEWADDSDDPPQWLSLSRLSYRGGGIMSRRARKASA